MPRPRAALLSAVSSPVVNIASRSAAVSAGLAVEHARNNDVAWQMPFMQQRDQSAAAGGSNDKVEDGSDVGLSSTQAHRRPLSAAAAPGSALRFSPRRPPRRRPRWRRGRAGFSAPS